jgi:hypothetical protein
MGVRKLVWDLSNPGHKSEPFQIPVIKANPFKSRSYKRTCSNPGVARSEMVRKKQEPIPRQSRHKQQSRPRGRIMIGGNHGLLPPAPATKRQASPSNKQASPSNKQASPSNNHFFCFANNGQPLRHATKNNSNVLSAAKKNKKHKNRKRRKRPGTGALLEIQRMQKSHNLLIPKAPFGRVVRLAILS